MIECHAALAETTRVHFGPFELDNSVLTNLVMLGDLLWAVAYILIIRQCFRQRTYGLPLIAIAMNFTWELQYSLVLPPRCDDGSVDVAKTGLILAWVALDAVIVWQLFRYGRSEQTIPEIRRHFPAVVLIALVLGAIGNYTFAEFHPNEAAPLSGLILNFVMSLLFIFLIFARPDLRGIPWSGALFRVAGNCVIFFANIFLLRQNAPGVRDFALFLFAGTALFDFTFLKLLFDRRHGLPAVAPA